ncbi:glycerol-3-phosphate 1-O-acyltransferase PlsY [bacterium]|nr:glycerol-3-phosphate 1-O-acyltransferase PlsY [bacterium]
MGESSIFIYFILVLFLSYVLGSLPNAYLMGKWIKGIDLRQYGSGNVGFTNLYRVTGFKPAIIVLLVDILKGLIPVLVGLYLFAIYPNARIMAIFFGMAAIIGHNWSIFLKGKGGKGVATSTGVFLALIPIPTVCAFIIFVIIVFFTHYISLGSILGSISLLSVAYLRKEPQESIIFAVIVVILIIIKHHPNIKRLLNKNENKFNLFKK